MEGDFHILLFAYCFDDDDVQVIDMAQGGTLPPDVLQALEDPEITKIAWNASFERTCLSHYLRHRLDPRQWKCAMVWAASLSLPLSLKAAAMVLKTGEQKDRAGVDLIRYFSIPCKPTKSNGGRTRNLPVDAPEKWELFKSYNAQDVRTERDIRKCLESFPMPDSEWEAYWTDQDINDRGVRIDMDLVHSAIDLDEKLSEQMDLEAKEITGLENPNSVSQLRKWLDSRGIETPSLGKKEVEDLIKELEKDSLDVEAMEMLKLRLQMAKSSVKKYQAAERCVCADGRAHGLFQFNGANRTGRFSGRLLQLQNLKRNSLESLDQARELVKLGDLAALDYIYGQNQVTDILSQLVRTMLIPSAGHEFVVADFSAIEARVLAWEAGEQWTLNAFRNGEDLYCAVASSMFGVPVEKHGINGELRQKGKIATLACGYQGGVGALKSMGALEMGLKEDELPEIIQNWRDANPHVVQFWWDVQQAAADTIRDHTMKASWIDEGEEIPETDTKFGQTTLSAYKLGTTIKISNELLNDSAFDLASYIATRFGVAMGTAEEQAFLSGTGEKQPTGILNDTNGAELGTTTSSATKITFDDVFDLYYSLRAPYRKNAAFLCNEALMLTLMKLKDGNGNYIWKPSLDIAKPDTILGRPVYTSVYMPEIKAANKVMLFGDYKYYYVADRQARTFKRLNELYARTDQVGFITTQRVDGKLILPEAVKYFLNR